MGSTVWGRYILCVTIALQCAHVLSQHPPLICRNLGVKTNVTADGETLQCDCQDNWGGPSCGVCKNDSVCPTDVPCDQTFAVVSKKYMECDPPTDLFPEIAGTTAEVTFDNVDKIARLVLWNTQTGPPAYMSCEFTDCTYDNSAGPKRSHRCNKSKCTCSDFCSFLSKGLIERAATHVDINCDDDAGTCSVAQTELQVALTVTCRRGECAVFTPALLDEVIVVIVAACIIGSVGFGCFGYSKYNKRLIEKQSALPEVHTETNVPKMDVVFNKVSYNVEYAPTSGNLLERVYTLYTRTVLTDVTGSAQSGELLGVLGPSGSGKTTLLDILARRRPATDGLDITINQIPLASIKRSDVGYVAQHETLMASQTVRESLMFTASTRLPETMTLGEKIRRVEAVIHSLGLSRVADSRIGSESHRGLSGGEKKRVAIGIELVTSPGVILLDEPTSGLDSYNAFQVMKTLAKLAAEGRTVIVSIHQPRSNIWDLFSKVLILQHGRVMFHGSPALVGDFLDEVPSVANLPVAHSSNTADYVVDVVTCANTDEVLDISDHYINSSHYTTVQETISELKNRSYDEGASHTYVTSFWNQFMALNMRTLTNLLREPRLLIGHILGSVILAAIVGGFFADVQNTIQGVQDRAGSYFFLATLLSLGSLSCLEQFIEERMMFQREHASGCYRTSAYALSKIVCDFIPLRIIPAALVAVVVYWIIGYQDTPQRFFVFLILLMLINSVAGAMVMWIGSCVKDVSTGNFIASIAILLMALLGGFLINKDTMNPNASWLLYLSYFNYAFEALMTNELTSLIVKFQASGFDELELSGTVFLAYFGLKRDNFFTDVIALFVMAVGYLILTYIALRTHAGTIRWPAIRCKKRVAESSMMNANAASRQDMAMIVMVREKVDRDDESSIVSHDTTYSR
eukprot:GFYU01010970.1.p1 GENE.GFYU01010970.1~~GFYU01010970.1.p1  ORF type:complete len:914 (-),score=228.79 GFYU01010970.1:148-2889(-)